MQHVQLSDHNSSVFLVLVHAILFTHLKFDVAPITEILCPKYIILSFIEPVYYDPTDYFDITQHEVDRQDELEYEVRAH